MIIISAPCRFTERDRVVNRYAPLLNNLTAEEYEGVVRNMFEVALAHPEEKTSQAFFRQIETHSVTEPPDSGDDVATREQCGWVQNICWIGQVLMRRLTSMDAVFGTVFLIVLLAITIGAIINLELALR